MDLADVAQRRQQEDIDHALQGRRPIGPGRAVCSKKECDEPISALRQNMGARLCIQCAQDAEQEAQRWQPRAHK